MTGSVRSIEKAIRAALLPLLAFSLLLSTLSSCPTPLGDSDDIADFIDDGKSIVRIRSATFYDGSAVLSRAPSGKNISVVLDIINPSNLDVTYTITPTSSGLLSVAPQEHPCPDSCTRLAFSFTAAVGAEQRDLEFTVGKYVASTNRTFPDEKITVTCDSPPGPAESVDAAYNTSNKVFTAFRLPSGAENADLSKLELTYARADGSGTSKTVTLDVSSSELTTVADPNILLDSDGRNRYFQPTDVVSGKAYNFWITIIDAAGQKSATVDTTRLDPNTTRAPIFTTSGGLFAQAETTKTVTIRGDTPGSVIYWRTGSGAYAAGASNPLSLELSGSATVQAYCTKAGLANSAVAEETYELQCLAPDIAVTGAGTPSPTATIAGRTAGATLWYRYSYQTDAVAEHEDPSGASMATAAMGTPADGGSFVAWATKTGWTDSNRSVTDSNIKVATPVFTTEAGTYVRDANLPVAVSCATAGSTVLWRRVGDATYTSLGASSGTITLTEGADLVIMATKSGYVDSNTADERYDLKCQTPTMTPNFSGVWTNDTFPITISCDTSGATINWSHAGGSGTGGSLSIDRSLTVTAYASRSGWVDSDSATGTYTLQCAAPVPSPGMYAGVYTGGASFPITLSGGTTGATYNWSHAGGSGTGGSLSIDRSRTVTSYCSRPGWTDSAAVTGTYAFTPEAPSITAFSTGNPNSGVYAMPDYAPLLTWTGAVFNFGGNLSYQYAFDAGTWYSVGSVTSAYIDVSGLSSGTRSVSVRAYNPLEGSYSAESSAVSFLMDSADPTVDFDSVSVPGSDAYLSFITADSGGSGVVTFELTLDGTVYAIATTGGTTVLTFPASASTHDYTAIVYDAAGNTGSTSGSVTF